MGTYRTCRERSSEIVEVLGRSALRVRELVPIATERSLGRDADLRDEVYPVVFEGDDAAARATRHRGSETGLLLDMGASRRGAWSSGRGAGPHGLAAIPVE